MNDLAPALREKLLKIRVLILDVDGVLTDGRIIIDDDGKESKFFDVRDGHGLKVLMRYGIDVIFMTGRNSRVVEHRARELGVKEVYQGIWDKLACYEEILTRRKLTDEEVAFVGDDIVDIPVLRRVGFAATVADAADETLAYVDYVAKKRGGRGAVREICNLLLKAQGYWPQVREKYQF
ncbi:MAG TPA: HAD-IIIA family hydrolase [Syntrophales bacterium]|nr:HAD-IIIA family hydrolase [Syntrophales bacterium]HOL59816.1 HAD-IIIA family hydrolase [Syntrophales bacterium]HPO35966.1 HAD-IIIA family hydrolase [Syntrophales bacterium]